ncbi:ribosome maturation factor RimP [Paenisporosarcina quisquiliarum]|jgi:ribosome maturation factor RimP|uniref:Ribosome maturation factor RimP n=1 Tax=Psychrobacillus psychrodurans TaxID=126157 RepID=A0A9X3L9Y3_9BACI|nr:ribosome maturation factor RimP [Psychrobacillus psychrodurans]MCZ8532746.1 ribosome maturation factor RimP [Psychrobacillus psychrodurans]MCZ8539574.1 ribosome maturation factor RimP [Psychrobacillus psychrodurans]SEM20701.1 ribosome maturation factor RimP [Paenisporosarcina quisquiliarum]SFM41998.1 ribosome maturation factor RimP [Psychrobacillus psychrodurans]
MSNITSKIEELVSPILQELNLDLVDIEYVKEGRDWFLRIYIDTPTGGIDIEQCAQVSEKLSEKLDVEDPISENYFLEVSSPGAERPLKKDADFTKAIGKYVYIKTYEPVNGAKEFEGTLLSYSIEEGALIEVRVKTRRVKIQIEKEKIALARLAIDFSA